MISLILIPFIILLLGFEGYLEERLLLFPKFGDKFVMYEQQTPNRLFPSPYNTVLTIIGSFIRRRFGGSECQNRNAYEQRK